MSDAWELDSSEFEHCEVDDIVSEPAETYDVVACGYLIIDNKFAYSLPCDYLYQPLSNKLTFDLLCKTSSSED